MTDTLDNLKRRAEGVGWDFGDHNLGKNGGWDWSLGDRGPGDRLTEGWQLHGLYDDLQAAEDLISAEEGRQGTKLPGDTVVKVGEVYERLL